MENVVKSTKILYLGCKYDTKIVSFILKDTIFDNFFTYDNRSSGQSEIGAPV